MRKMNQRGFTLIEVVISMTIISVVLFVGYMVLNNSSKLIINQARSSDIQNGVNIIKQNAINDIKGSTSIVLNFDDISSEVIDKNTMTSMYEKIKSKIKKEKAYDYSYTIKYNNNSYITYTINTINENKRILYSVNRIDNANINLISKQEIDSDNEDIPIEIYNNNGRYEINIKSIGSKKSENYRFDVFPKTNEVSTKPQVGNSSFMMDCLVRALKELGWKCEGYLNVDIHDDNVNCTEIYTDINNCITDEDLKEAFEELKKMVCTGDQKDITVDNIESIRKVLSDVLKSMLTDGNNGHNKAIDELFEATLYLDIAHKILICKDRDLQESMMEKMFLAPIDSIYDWGKILSSELNGDIGEEVSRRAVSNKAVMVSILNEVKNHKICSKYEEDCINTKEHKDILEKINTIIRNLIDIQTLVVEAYCNKQDWGKIDNNKLNGINIMMSDLIQLKYNLKGLNYMSKVGS